MIPAALLERLRAERRLELHVKVVPKSSRDEIVGMLDDGSLKIKITAAPEKGKANAALCGFLAREFGVPRRSVRVSAGETSPRKHMVIEL